MSKDENQKRPAWYRISARAKYDAESRAYSELQKTVLARTLPKDEADSYDVEIPYSWRSQPASYLLRTLGLKKGLPPGSGAGYVQSPYSDIYTKIYGVSPIADLPKYRTMFRTCPDIQQAVEMQINLAIGKGYTIAHSDTKVVDYLTKVCSDIHLIEHMLAMASDCMVYGNSFTEIQWNESLLKEEQMYEYQGENYTQDDLNSLNIKNAKRATINGEYGTPKNFVAQTVKKSETADRILGLKNLDPVYMRLRRDSWGNVFGAIQWLSFPPVLIDNDSYIHIKYRPKSTAYEGAYGTSVLMPIIRNNELLSQLEADCAIWIHMRAIPPLIVKGGTPERPYSTAQMQELMGALKSRTASTMIFAKGDISFEEFKTIASELNIKWWIDYLLNRRYQALGVPPMFMGHAEKAGRATAEVLLHDFVTRLQVLQEFISRPIVEKIFRPLIDAEFGEEVENAQIIWKPIVEEDRNMRSQRLVQLLQCGAISVNEARVEMGFERINETKYDSLIPKEPATQPSGFPSKEKKSLEVREPTPESHLKLEELDSKTKKFELMQIEDTFRERMLDLVKKTRANLKDDSKLVKNVKKGAHEECEKLVNEHVLSSYLSGRAKANDALGIQDNLSLNKDDLKPLANMKESLVKDFDKILKDMVEMKEDGILT